MSYSNVELQAMVRDESVHKKLYTDPGVFDLEMQRIYTKVWVYIGHDSQVPNVGDYITTTLGTQEVIMCLCS